MYLSNIIFHPVQTASFTFKGSVLTYHKIGSGPKILLFFHGYGQNGKVFEDKAHSLDQYTCYLFDLFFHGESTWAHEEEALSKEHWKDLIISFLSELHIDRFSIAGFSLGGRFVFATLQVLPDHIDEIFLLAPDGVKTNFWYNLATYPTAFRKLFKSMILHPNRFFKLAKFIYTTGLVDKGLIRFAESQMKTAEMRSRVYYSWVVFRWLTFDMKDMARLILDHQISTTLVVGRYDKVITVKNMGHLLQHLPQSKIQILETGHNGIISKWIH